MLIAAGVFVVVVGVTRYVSVGSICAAVALVAAAAARGAPAPVVLRASVAALIIVVRHRANLARVVAGTEHRIGQRA
jgi:glycerol-3-phosphate acyltransferase PlsY